MVIGDVSSPPLKGYCYGSQIHTDKAEAQMIFPVNLDIPDFSAMSLCRRMSGAGATRYALCGPPYRLASTYL
ncbi:hypothetical protein J6590_068654 [Homalodisca vitripennis]|nr:hypothetical protein J6590_068654 [Homalodisca vitripennis]